MATDWQAQTRIVIHDVVDPETWARANQVTAAKPAWARLHKTAGVLGRILGDFWIGLRTLVLGVLPVVALGVLGWSVWTEIHSDRIEIAPIAVPASISAMGFTPEVVARHLFDEIGTIQRRAATTMRRTQAEIAGEEADFTVPGIGLSLGTVVQAVRRILGLPARRVTGDIASEGPLLAIRLRFGGAEPVSEIGVASVEGMDALLRDAARGLLLRVSPYMVASYAYETETDAQRVLALARRVEQSNFGPPETRWRAITLQGLVFAVKLRDPERAVAEYRRAIAMAPGFAIAHSNLGSVLHGLGRHEEAERSYREALRLDPNYAGTHNNLGNALRDLGRREEAERSYREALRLDPNYAFAHNNLGVVLRDLGRREEAERSHREALRLDPNYAFAHNNLGVVLSDLGRREEAERSYREALRLDPNYAFAHNNLAVVLRDLGRREEAERSYREALRLDPSNALTHNNLALLLEEVGRLPEALAVARTALTLEPTESRRALVARLEGAAARANSLKQPTPAP